MDIILEKIKKNLKRKFSDFDKNSNDDDDDCNSEIDTLCKHVYMRNNDIYFKTDVTLQSVEMLIKLIDKHNDKIEYYRKDKSIKLIKPYPLKLHITSYGGDLQIGLMAADAIENSKIPIHTIVEGYAASAATFMSIVGKKRYITKRSNMLIHQLRTVGFIDSKFEEQKDDYENNKMFMENVKILYKKYTKLTETQIESELKHDLWHNSNECLQFGFVDTIL